MRRPIEVWHFIISIMILIMSVGSTIITLSNRVTDQNARIMSLEQNKRDTKEQFDHINERLDRLTDKATEILVELQNKKDRDK
jgi:cell division protein FtsL